MSGQVIKIEVVKKNDELLFYTQGIYLDLLDPHDFYYADISVVRGGNEVMTGRVFEIGTHGPSPVFSMRGLIYIDCNGRQLSPHEFMVGDKICVQIRDGFDWQIDYKNRYASTMVWKSLGHQYDEILSIVNADEFKRRGKEFIVKTTKLISEFPINESSVFRRKER